MYMYKCTILYMYTCTVNIFILQPRCKTLQHKTKCTVLVHTCTHVACMYCTCACSLAGPPLCIESKGLIQRKHTCSTRSLLQKYCSPIRLQPCDLAHAFPFRHHSKN